MNWIFGLVVVAAIAFVFWDAFIRGRRGPALVVGGILYGMADKAHESRSNPSSS
jgi:hypothetical protein